jgi:hypothetical protein
MLKEELVSLVYMITEITKSLNIYITWEKKSNLQKVN